MSAGEIRERAAALRVARGRVDQLFFGDPAFVDLIDELVGFAGAVADVVDRPAVVLRGNRVEIPTSEELAADPRIDGFMRVAAFVGAAGRNGGGANAAELLAEVGKIIASVHGMPNPNAEDTARHYRREAMQRLTHKQRSRLGMRGEDMSEVGK